VNISSIGGKMATPMGGWYHASKFAVEGLSDSLRMEVQQFGIDVIVVEPGGIQSEWGDIAMGAMLAASQHSAYAGFAQAAKKTTDAQATKSKAPDPIIIARIIKKAIEARHPKARYAAGFMARPILFLRKILSDAAFDKIILSQFK
jgi:NAD(P)-dependent dehydrogenase (short-subunit alcohol dehydrogenase family)